MSFPRLYTQIERMIKSTVLDTQVARDIVRKSGLVGGDTGASLLDQLLTPPPHSNLPQVPRRRVQNDLSWPYHIFLDPSTELVPPGNTYWDGRHDFSGSRLTPDSDTTRDALQDMQKQFHGVYFSGFSDHARPPVGAYLGPPGHNNTSEPLRFGRCWVGGATSYDPFPFPGYFLWADLAETGVTPYIDTAHDVGRGPTPGDTYDAGAGQAVGPIIIKTWASLDQGVTWEAPWEEASLTGGGTNAGSAYQAKNLNPLYHPTDPEEDGFVSSAVLRESVRRDDVLFKFTLSSTDPENWLEFQTLGLHINFLT